jgi:hypothetical protein
MGKKGYCLLTVIIAFLAQLDQKIKKNLSQAFTLMYPLILISCLFSLFTVLPMLALVTELNCSWLLIF